MPGPSEDPRSSPNPEEAALGAGTVTLPGPATVGQPRLDDLPPPGPSPDGEGGRMTLAEHLAELRRRLLICIAAVVVTAIAGWFVYKPVLDFMEHSYVTFCHKHPGKLLSCSLLARTPTEGFLTRLKLAGYLGIAMAAPVWLWELWRFITPGLKKNEKRYAVPFLLSALTLFAMGVSVAILVWPKALNWLIGVAGPGVQPAYSISSYVSLYTLICLVFGAVFLYPIIVVFLMISGVVPTTTWRRWRRVAIVVLCSVAAIVTPSNDPFTFLGMAVPMILLYEVSIVVGRLLGK
jgi:sec-independent protein translocase protein TatC